MSEPQAIADRVRAFVAEERGLRLAEIQRSSRLEEDLGMTGDDAAMFLEAFVGKFGADLSGLDLHKHFGPECCNPLWLFAKPAWLRDLGNYPVTVDHLIRVAEAGRWFSPPCIEPAAEDHRGI